MRFGIIKCKFSVKINLDLSVIRAYNEFKGTTGILFETDKVRTQQMTKEGVVI